MTCDREFERRFEVRKLEVRDGFLERDQVLVRLDSVVWIEDEARVGYAGEVDALVREARVVVRRGLRERVRRGAERRVFLECIGFERVRVERLEQPEGACGRQLSVSCSVLLVDPCARAARRQEAKAHLLVLSERAAKSRC